MKIKRSDLKQLASKYIGNNSLNAQNQIMIKIAVARAARLSYTNHLGDINYEKDIQLHDKLLLNKHMSPFEHCARAMNKDEYYEYSKGRDGQKSHEHGWCDNFRGFVSYRHLLCT